MTDFGHMLKGYLHAEGRTQKEFAGSVQCDAGFLSQVISGRRRPPLGQIDAWAKALGLKGSDRDAFLLAAQLAHTPAPVVERLKALEAQQQPQKRTGRRKASE